MSCTSYDCIILGEPAKKNPQKEMKNCTESEDKMKVLFLKPAEITEILTVSLGQR